MNRVAIAFSAQVSAAQHPPAQTLTSPVVALGDRIAQRGAVLNPAPECIDLGYGGATLIRPALERQQEALATSGVAPAAIYLLDRLGPQAADQLRSGVVFQRAGMRVLLLTRPVGDGLEPADAHRVPWRCRSPRPSPLAVTVTALVPAVTPRRPL
jgi:hypothetical protein